MLLPPIADHPSRVRQAAGPQWARILPQDVRVALARAKVEAKAEVKAHAKAEKLGKEAARLRKKEAAAAERLRKKKVKFTGLTQNSQVDPAAV